MRKKKKYKDFEKPIKKDNFMLKIAITEVIFLAMFIFTSAHLQRLQTYNNLVGSFASVFKYVTIIIFFVSLDFVVFFYSILSIWMIEGQIIKSNWVIKAYNIDKKYDLFMFIFKIFSILFFIMIFIITPCAVDGESMSPTFQTNDSVVTFNLYYEPKVDDIIVFDATKYTDKEDERFFIKRIKAVPGDIISFDALNDKCYVNGKLIEGVSLIHYQYFRLSIDYDLKLINDISETIGKKEISLIDELFSKISQRYQFVVPENRFLVLGDNINNSYDSRYFGLIDSSSIYGKVFVRIYPKFEFFTR